MNHYTPFSGEWHRDLVEVTDIQSSILAENNAMSAITKVIEDFNYHTQKCLNLLVKSDRVVCSIFHTLDCYCT